TLAPISHPFWLTFLAALAAFGAGHLVVAYVRPGWGKGVITVALLAGAAAGIWSMLRAPARAPELHGFVDAGSIARDADGAVRFSVDGKPVRYRGTVPDGFRARTEVILHGATGADGLFEATDLVARCPSSYPVKQASDAPGTRRSAP